MHFWTHCVPSHEILEVDSEILIPWFQVLKTRSQTIILQYPTLQRITSDPPAWPNWSHHFSRYKEENLLDSAELLSKQPSLSLNTDQRPSSFRSTWISTLGIKKKTACMLSYCFFLSFFLNGTVSRAPGEPVSEWFTHRDFKVCKSL